MTAPHTDRSSQETMMQLVNGMVVSRCVSLAAELAIADHLEDGPRHLSDLATETGTDPDALYRLLRALAGLGIFAEHSDRCFQNTRLSEVLRTDAHGSVRHYARWVSHPLHWRMMGNLDYSIRTGRSALTKDHPDKRPFEILSQDSSAQVVFNDAMTELSASEGAAIVDTYDFSGFGRIVDVGGGHGQLAMLIARQAPDASVVVYDLPHVVDGAKYRISRAGLDGRIEAIGGDILEAVPGPADLCVLKNILHGWDDETARRALGNCRAALRDGGRVLVCEKLITSGQESVVARIMDIEMLAGPGGHERSAAEFSNLFETTGFTLDHVIETRTPLRLLEAVAV